MPLIAANLTKENSGFRGSGPPDASALLRARIEGAADDDPERAYGEAGVPHGLRQRQRAA
jgi:hypothetical protein